MDQKIIITIHHGKVEAVHASLPVEVHVIDEDKKRNGDAAYVAGLKHDVESMIQVYPKKNGHKRPHMRSGPPKK